MQQEDHLARLRVLSPAKRAFLLKKLAQQAQDSVDVSLITPQRQTGPVALSFAQQQLFFLYLLDPTNPAYNLAIALRFTGTLDVSALVESIQAIVQRHEVLRTTITVISGEPVQHISPELHVTPKMIDARTYSEAERGQVVETELATSFDLTHGPLIQATILHVAEQEHVLLLSMHHIVSDGWSIGILTHEITTLYESFEAGKPSPLPALPIQYADYVRWQRQWLQGEVREKQLMYWREQLAGVPTLLALPTDHPRPASQRYLGDIVTFQLSHKMRTSLQQLSKAEDVTLFMTLLTAFQVLIAFYSGSDDFLIGTPVANRTSVETEGLVGCFVNTLVLRSNLAGNPSFRQLLVRTREVCLGAYAHQAFPFEMLVEALQPERNASYNPLFQVMFALQNAPKTTIELSGLRVDTVEELGQTSKFDLTLSMTEIDEGIEGVLEYNSDLFERVTIERFHDHFLTLLQSIIETPKQCVFDLQILTPQEKYYLLHELNPSSLLEEGSNPSTLCLHQFFEAQAQRTPEAVALYDGEETLSYRDLNRQAQVLSFQLRELGVGPEMLVGLCMRRSTQLVVGLLAILKAGGAYVPLDPTYPEERLAFILNDTQASILLTQSSLRERLPDYQGTVILLDSALLDDDGEASEFLERATTGNLSYVIYTSGSTGRPKGVAITHGSAAQLVAWAQKVYAREELSGVLASTSICFDLSIFEIFVPLSVGGSCILVENALQLSSQTAMNTITLVNTVPSVAREVLRTGGFPSSVQTINLAGEALSLKLVQDLYAHTQVRRIFNLYGPSEDTTYSTSTLLSSTTSDVPSIGRPLESTRVYLLDERLCLVPPGMPGEIYIGGAGLARGYLNRPDLSAERFIPDTFSGEPGARLYKTGDLARYLVDGRLDFLGRIDHQIKLRGFRIELGEIEAVLSHHPEVRESIVTVHYDANDVAYLIAYVISLQAIKSDDLRLYAQEQLPAYMVPSTFFVLTSFPLTANGKVDRKALWSMSRRDEGSVRKIVGPRDLIELRLIQLWEQVLQRKSIGVQDNFFELGGHSLLAIQLVAQMQQQFATNIALSVLIQQGTIEHIAHLIRTANEGVEQSPLVALQPVGANTPLFCVHPAGGSVLCYVDLARHLERPFYGLQAENLYAPEPVDTSLEEMAAHYIIAIQTVQPQGPYLLGGWSLGGAVAFEMARQLKAQGQDIAMLVLIDAGIPALTMEVPVLSSLEMVTGFALHLGLSQELLDTLPADIDQASWNEQWDTLFALMKYGRIIPTASDEAYLQRLFRVYQATISSWLAYRPQLYQGPLALIKASNRDGWEDDGDEAMGWAGLVNGDVMVLTTPGDHYTLMRQPNIRLLAERVQQCLDAAIPAAP